MNDKAGFLHGQPIGSEYWQEQIAKCNMDAVPDRLQIRYGFSAERASLRLLPCEDFISATGSFCPETQPVGTAQSINTVVINDLYMLRRSGASWLESLNAAVVFR